MINIAGRRLSTPEAAARLGVKPETLYAYVSRGMLRREKGTGGSTFDPQEVERLAARSRGVSSGSRSPANLAFVTELTLIEDGRLRYRGEDAIELSRHRTYEEVARWLWSGSWDGAGSPGGWEAPAEAATVVAAAVGALGEGALPSDRYKVAVAAAATVDVWRHHLIPEGVISIARTIGAAMVGALPVVAGADAAAAGVAARLWCRLCPRQATAGDVAVLDAALVLLADHELAASTLAVRVAAAFGADPYSAVSTGLGAASGILHAANSTAVVELLEDALARTPADAVADRLRAGHRLPGFGQPLYPAGDPRGTELLDRVAGMDHPEDRAEVIEEMIALARDRSLPPPNVDFALAALAFGQEMVQGAGEAIFILARSAGWVAHAMEEYSSRTTFRVRATYVGRRA